MTVPGPGWHPLALRPRRRTSVAAATDHRIVLDEGRSSVIRWIGLHVTGGKRGHIGRPRARMERPVLCTVVCRFDAAAEGRAAAGRFDVADSHAPAGGRPVGPAAGRATRPGGWRLDPLQGKTPAGAG